MEMNWIPVTERLPDSDITVMIATPDESEPVWLGYYSGDDGWLFADGMPAENVTHWMDLPAPPEVPSRTVVI